jgi:hypothetical protein
MKKKTNRRASWGLYSGLMLHEYNGREVYMKRNDNGRKGGIGMMSDV